MLADADEQDGNVGGVHEADQGADHVSDRVALGDDKAVERAVRAQGRVEVACLRHGIRADKGLAEEN